MKVIFFFLFFRSLLKSTFTPLPIFWLLLFSVFIFYLAGKKRFARLFFALSVFWLFLISTPFLPKALLSTLENRYNPILLPFESETRLHDPDSIVHILVLGNGYETDSRLSSCDQLSSSGMARLVEGIRIHRLLPNSILIFSGNAGYQPVPQSKVSALAAQELGVDSNSIQILTEPWNTKNEAIEYYKRYGASHKLYLITDAAHMPRAIMHFRNNGLIPIPVPTNFVLRKNLIPGSLTDYLPGSHNIRFMEIVFQEYLGILWALLGGD